MANKTGIGSELYLNPSELDIKTDNIFKYLESYNTIFFHSGRKALSFLYSHLCSDGKRKSHILLPDYICESVINVFPRSKIAFYPVTDSLEINFDCLFKKINQDDSVGFVFLMHYFGKLQDQKLLAELKRIAVKKNIIIIEDTTHSIFTKKETIGDYMVSSLRKWFPIPHGAVLYSNNNLEHSPFPKIETNQRSAGHILKWVAYCKGVDLSSIYRDIFAEEENDINKIKGIYEASDFAKYLLSCFSIQNIKKKRLQNYNYLKQHLDYLPINDINKNDCPFVYCIDAGEERDKLREYLGNRGVFCAVHWPYYSFENDNRSHSLSVSNRLLSLPIDQRYCDEDMAYIVKMIKGFRENV